MRGTRTLKVVTWQVPSYCLLDSAIRYDLGGTSPIFRILLLVLGVTRVSLGPPTWDSVVQIIAAVILLVAPAVVFRGYARWHKKSQLEKLFTAESQSSQEARAFAHVTDASIEVQRVNLTLRMGVETYVEFIAIYFEGSGRLPVIQLLDDWHYERGKTPDAVKINWPPNVPHKAWYWNYSTTNHRFPDTRITIGMEYLATGYFDGSVVFDMTTTGGKAKRELPFSVRESSARLSDQ